MNIEVAIVAIESFQGDSLTTSLSKIESDIRGMNSSDVSTLCEECKVDDSFIQSALTIKKVASQINVVIHAAGILRSLEGILEKDEIIESTSLGAGNTGRSFDLETNLRIAEFKFIDWQGGAESIRQNSIFKDFYTLAEHKTDKKKVLYVVDTFYPMKFFNGSRVLTSVLSRQPVILSQIVEKYGKDVQVTRDYYEVHKDSVSIEDVSPFIGRA